MKKAKRKHSAEQAEFRPRAWHLAAGVGVALVAAMFLYGPALSGPFLFDDVYLPFYLPGFAEQPLIAWLSGMRPALMFTFWMSHRIHGIDPAGYHLFNIAVHAVNALLVFLVFRKLLNRGTMAVFGAALFLVHPLQTESVAYIASRSECLSGFFMLAAFTVFVYHAIPAISFRASLAVLVFFGLACLTKEHAAILPALLLLTDYFWNPGFTWKGVRRNWRLYAPLAALAAIGGIFVFRVLRVAESAGFGIKELPWYNYFFTQCRVIWTYIRLAVLPFGQNLDYDYAISRSLMDHLAIAGLAGLLTVTVGAVFFRKRFPLAAYGWFVFLILLAPTSSVVPIRDVIAERRMYLPLLGLLLISLDFLRRAQVKPRNLATVLAAVLIFAGALTWKRNYVWSNPIALWQDTVQRSPDKVRPHFQLGFAYFHAGQCVEALPHYDTAARLEPPEPALLIDWALALDCASRPADALAKLHQAAAANNTAHVYALMGMIHGKNGRREEALMALDTAAQLDPSFEATYVYRGNVFQASGETDRAAAEYARALSLNPDNEDAQRGLAQSRRRPKL